MSGMRSSVEHLVIGGGPAGSMLAMRLAAAGREVVLLEKERGPHDKVCGEFLSREAVEYLRQAGIEPLDLGACAIQYVRLHARRKIVGAELPFTALSLSRRVMDEVLLAKAEGAGCVVRRGSFVEKMHAAGNRWWVGLRGGRTIDAKTVFLATGKHDLNGWERGRGSQNDLIGFKMHWRLAPAQMTTLGGVMELFLFRGGYGGLSLVEGNTANLCLVVRKNRLRQLGGWAHLQRAILAEVRGMRERLRDGEPCWTKPLAISSIPYGYSCGSPGGVWRVGDQAAVIPSFTGDGMSIALHSAALAAEMYLNGKSVDTYIGCLKDQLQSGMRFATNLSRVMVTPGGRALAPLLLSLIPSAMGGIAASTRIPDSAMRRARLEAESDGRSPAQVA